jgi:hypothetical protein
MSSQRKTVDLIREDFGFNGRDPQPAGRLATGLANALQLLSKELYAYDGHFILELIQNADDNKYDPDVEPMIDIQVGPDAIIIRNNESGFTEANVQAICHVGESTKRDKKFEATGEKGIGFKAVFKVSRRPEIHSNGFHFCFDTKLHGALGMVLPEWLPESSHRHDPGVTTVVLPREPDLEAPKDLVGQFVAELPLFLRCLRHLKIADTRTSESVELRRSDRDGLTSIDRTMTKNGKSVTTKHLFFRHESKYDVSDIRDEKREGIRTTTVVVAIPLKADGSMDRSQKRRFFAFLPVKDSGLNFVVHADFILNASREDVLKDREWNRRLRQALGNAIADAVVAMQKRNFEGYTALCALCDPEGIPDQFIKPMMVRAIECLAEAHCIPGNGGSWLKPKAAICPDQAGLAHLLSDEDIAANLKKAFVSKLAKKIEEPLKLLKVELFTFETLLKICSDRDWIKSRSIPWLQGLFERLDSEVKTPARLERVKQAPLFRLYNGRHVAAKDGTIYRSLKGKRQYGFEDDLNVLHPDLVGAQSKRSTDNPINSLLEKVGIRDANPVTIIDGHILPKHGGKQHQIEKLIAHAHFLLENFKAYVAGKQSSPNALIDLSKTFRLLSQPTGNGGRSCHPASQLYVGSAFGDPNDMEGLLGPALPLIAKEYLSCHSTPEPERWRELFLQLGANEMPRLSESGGDFELSVEMRQFTERNNPEMNGRLLGLLEANYESWTRRRLAHQQWNGTSAFCDALGDLALTVRGNEPQQARQAFLDNERNRAVFGTNVSYLDQKFNNEEFAEQIGVACRPSVERVLLRLEQLSEVGPASKEQVTTLYMFLEEHWSSAATEIRKAFSSKRIVFFSKPDSGIELHSAFLRDCCWTMPMKLQPYCSKIALKRDWDPLREFFRKHLEVVSKPSGADWLRVISEISQSTVVADLQGELALAVYKELDELLKRSRDDSKDLPSWVFEAKQQEMIFTARGDWRSPGDQVYEADDEQLASTFADAAAVSFIGVPNDQRPQLRSLFDALDIPRVSEATRFPPDWDAGNADAALMRHIRGRWSDIARIAYAGDHRGYTNAKRGGQLLQIRDLEVRVYWPLEMDVSIAGEIRRHPFPTHLYWQADRARLMVDSDERQSWLYIAESIVRFMNIEGACTDLISMVLSAKDGAEIERIFKQKKLAPLPQLELDCLNEPYVDEDDDLGFDSDFGARSQSGGVVSDNPRDGTKERLPIRAKSLLSGVDGPASSKIKNAGGEQGSGVSGAPGVSPRKPVGAGVPPTGPDRVGGQQQGSRPKQRRLVSYVEADASPSSSQSNSEYQEQRTQTDEAAIAFVMQEELAAGREPTKMDHFNPGYDIESVKPHAGEVIFIEVKGITAEWGPLGVMLSRAQFEFARMKRENAWLYVVEYALDPDRRRIWRIQDPASKINKFGFDYKWRDLCEEVGELQQQEAFLREGVRYKLDEASYGVVLRVEARGAMYTVVVRRADDNEVTRTASLEMHRRAIGGAGGESRTSS